VKVRTAVESGYEEAVIVIREASRVDCVGVDHLWICRFVG